MIGFKDNLVSLDIETDCNVDGCSGKFSECDHGLDPYKSIITCIGVYALKPNGDPYRLVLRGEENYKEFFETYSDVIFVGQNFKFDYKMLKARGYNINIEQYAHDTQNMAAVSTSKVTPEYMAWYSKKRKELNDNLPKGCNGHRNAGPLSLKTLAPFFLKVNPFWEDPTSHDNDVYVLLDCEHTYNLYVFFRDLLKVQGLFDFYSNKLMPFTRMITEAECKGITINTPLVVERWGESNTKLEQVKEQLDGQWTTAYKTYFDIKRTELNDKYQGMLQKALDKKPKVPQKTTIRYNEMALAAMAKLDNKMNLNSPKQLTWILKDHFGLDISDFDDEDSTGRYVLNRLAATGREDIKTFLEYRKYKKLATAFFPSYMEMQHENVIHCNFNPTGTRTGRLSSSNPNLQQVPGHLHELFIGRPGYKLITRDLGAIEPCLAAYYTQDPELCNLIINGGDFHSRNAIIMFGLDCTEAQVKELYPTERKLAKTVGLALIYGAGPFRIQMTAATLGWDWPLWKCKEIFDNFKCAYQTAFDFKKQIDAFAVSNPIETYFGRKHVYPDPTDIYMKAFNTLVQSTGSDLLLQGAHDAYQEMKKLGLDSYPLLFVHDEVVFEVREDQVNAALELIDMHLTKFKLPTPYGNIPLKVEGKVSSKWEK